MQELKPFFVSLFLTLCIFGLGSLTGSGISVADAYRDEARILKWSPAWLSSDPERYSGSRTFNRPASLRGFYYKRLTDEEPPIYKWSPRYFSNPKTWNNGKRSTSVVWDDGDKFPSAGSPEWFQDDELINK